jgi:sugar lactone lactonase YvrE
MNTQRVGEYTKIAEGIYLEGLSYDFAREAIWYSDVIKGGVHGLKPDGTRIASFDDDRMWTGGVLMNADGSVLSSGPGGIRWNNPDSKKSGWLVQEIDGTGR